MGLIVSPISPDPLKPAASYVRLHGLRLRLDPERRRDGAWTVPPTRWVQAFVFGYHSMAARQAGRPPVWMDNWMTTLGDLGLVCVSPHAGDLPAGPVYIARTVSSGEIFAAIYAVLKNKYAGSKDDLAKRFLL